MGLSLKRRAQKIVHRMVNMTDEQRLIASNMIMGGTLIVVTTLFVRQRVRHHGDIASFNEAWGELFSDSTVFLKKGDLDKVLNGTPHEFTFETGDVLYLVHDK